MGDKTKWIFEDDDADGADGDAEFTESLTEAPPTTRVGDDDTPTELYTGGGQKTEIAFGWQEPEGAPALSEDVDPVVGWLVVVKGPGMGRALSIGTGVNAIGRSSEERVSLPFGDAQISQKDHAKVFYDDAAREFFIAHGSGKNITRMNGQIVANTTPLLNHATIELSKTTHLRFVAFCGEEFDWADVMQSGDGAA